MDWLLEILDYGSTIVLVILIFWQQDRVVERVLSLMEEKNEREFERWSQIIDLMKNKEK